MIRCGKKERNFLYILNKFINSIISYKLQKKKLIYFFMW